MGDRLKVFYCSMNLSALQTRVARDIVAYVRQEQFEEGHHLTELGLAKVLNTSRSPVKIAMQFLAEHAHL